MKMINTGIKIGMELPQSVIIHEGERRRVTVWKRQLLS